MRCHAKLLERAEHAVGGNAAQLALGDLHAAGQQGVVQGGRHQVAHMDVPGPGADLYRLALADVDLADQHMVGIGVLLQGHNAAHLHVMDVLAQVLGDLHLGAGQGHGLGELSVGGINSDKLIQPFSA